MSAFARCNGVKLWYETSGSSDEPALVLIGGLGWQAIDWAPELCCMFVERGFFVVRFDNRDSGLSTPFDEHVPNLGAALKGDFSSVPYSLEDMADDVVALLDELGLPKAHLVGASMGGMIAQIVAIRHPDRVLSLASVMSSTGRAGVGEASEEGRKRLMRGSSRDAGREEQIDLTLTQRRRMSSTAFPFEEEYERARIASSIDRNRSRQGRVRQLIATAGSPDRTSALEQLRIPTLVVHGNEDQVVDLTGGEATAHAIPDARLLVVDGMAHELPRATWPLIVDAIAANAHRSLS